MRLRWPFGRELEHSVAAKRRVQVSLFVLLGLLAALLATGLYGAFGLYNSAESRYIKLLFPLRTTTRDLVLQMLNEQTGVRAVRGAIEFLVKPFREQEILEAIQQGLARDRAWLDNEKATAVLGARFASLSAREREVMAHVVTGRLNKQIAADLGISEITVKVHRSHMMHKMQATSLPELARMADRLNLAGGKP